jgi:UDP-glucose 4-epimerase
VFWIKWVTRNYYWRGEEAEERAKKLQHSFQETPTLKAPRLTDQITLPIQRALITGASGFIGLHLCRALLGSGYEVHALSRSEPKVSDTRLHWHKVDLTDSEATRRAFARIRADLVWHLCSYAQGERELALVLPTFRGEIETAVNVLASVTESGCRRLIMAGSLEESDPGDVPLSPYAAAKAASRTYARMFHQLYGLPVVMTRIFMTYGPGQSAKKLIPHSIDCMLQGHPLKIASPSRKVDWLYVEDVVQGLLAVAAAPDLEGKSVDLGSGEMVEICDVVCRIQRLINPSALVEFDSSPGRALEQVRCADSATTYALTGWRPTISLDAGLTRTVDSYAGSTLSRSQ